MEQYSIKRKVGKKIFTTEIVAREALSQNTDFSWTSSQCKVKVILGEGGKVTVYQVMLMTDCRFQKEEQNDVRSWAGGAAGLKKRDMKRCGHYLTGFEGFSEIPEPRGE